MARGVGAGLGGAAGAMVVLTGKAGTGGRNLGPAIVIAGGWYGGGGSGAGAGRAWGAMVGGCAAVTAA